MPARRQPKRQNRKQGRPQKDMPAVGRETLIAATRKLVKTIPPGQITRLDIARAAGVDPALIRYYFGNKEALLATAVLEAGAQMRDRMRQDSAQGSSAADKIRRRMVALLEALYEDPSLHHLVIERIIHNYSKEARDFRHDLVFGACDNLASIIEEGVASGELASRRPSPPCFWR
jgi:Transcriptional regulator